jgi:hypothetical protein
MSDLAMPELRRALVDAARRRHETVAEAADRTSAPGHAYARGRGRRTGLRASRWRVLPVMLLLVLVGAAVAFASGLITFGAPVASVPVFANPRAGLGRVAPGTARLLPLSVPDPRGGLPWGMRVLQTTRGVGCLQVGRLLDGRLAALGQDGAFGDDGRAHELPLSTNVERLNCSFVDGHGRIFDPVTIKSQVASAAPGVYCEPPGTYAPSHHAAFSTCPLADERNLYYGTLGPDATSLTYSASGTSHTVATLGADGAYLIVMPGTTPVLRRGRESRTRGALRIRRDPRLQPDHRDPLPRRGHLVTAERWIYGARACAPPLPEPFGWVQIGVPTHAQLATPIHATLIRDAEGRPAIRVRFTSRVAISSLLGQYQLHWHEPGMAPDAYAAGPIDEAASASYSGLIPQGRNIAAGQTLTKTLDQNRFGPRLAPGITTGSVILDYATGPLIQAEEDTAKIPVGTFKIRIP